jgi:hypothetical protein
MAAEPTGRRVEALPLNTVSLGGTLFLRVVLTDKTSLHLAPKGSVPPGQPARPAVSTGRRSVREGTAAYDGAGLADRIWAEHTLCGLSWWQMATQSNEIELAARAASAQRRSYACSWCAHRALRCSA